MRTPAMPYAFDIVRATMTFGVASASGNALEIRVERRAVERIAVGFGELPEEGVDHGFAGTERILVAADPDCLDSRRKLRTIHAAAALPLLKFGHVFLVTACRHELRCMARTSDAQTLKE